MKLKILFDCHTFDMEPQGTSTFLAGLLNALPIVAKDSFDDLSVDLICAASDREAIDKYVDVPYTYEPISKSFLNRNFVSLPMVAWRNRPDFVVSQYVRPIWVPDKSVSVIHDLLFLDFPDQFTWKYKFLRLVLFGYSAKFSDVVLTVSDYSKERISQIYGRDLDDIHVVPNAVSPYCGPEGGFQHRNCQEHKRLRLLYVSRLEKRKRHEWCLKALNDLVAEGFDAELVLVGGGGGDFGNFLRAEFRNSPMTEDGRLFHFENIDSIHLDSLYETSDLFLFPSLGEGFGIPVIEAASRGVPCVVSDGSALAELRDFYVGESFSPTEYGSFIEAVIKVLKDIKEYQAQAERSAAQVRSHFTWNEAAKCFLASLVKKIESQ